MRLLQTVLALTLLMIANTSQAQAQAAPPSETSFIRSLPSSDLSPEQSKRLDLLRKLPSTQTLAVVNVNQNALRAAANIASIVQIPVLNEELSIHLQPSTVNLDQKQWSVTGQADNLPTGSSVFAVEGNSVTGSVQTEHGLYRIRPLGGGAHALIKVGRFPDEHPPSFQKLEQQQHDAMPKKPSPPSHSGTIQFKVLVAYTNDVATAVPDIKGLTDLAFLETNASYKNSGIPLEAILATETPLKIDYNETGSMDDELAVIKNPHSPNMSILHSTRASTHADIVVVLVNNSSYCGLAADIMARHETAFAVVYQDCATGYYSFGHEIGHLQGARHDSETDPTSTGPESVDCHGFIDTEKHRRTIMAYDCPGGCTRLPQWSRPPQWGVADRSDNTRCLRDSADAVSKLH